MDKMIAIYLLVEDKVWDKLEDLFPKLILDGSIRWKMRPDRLINYAVNKYGCLARMWKAYGLM